MGPHGWLPVLRCQCDKNDPVIFALKLSFDFIRSPSFQSISFLYLIPLLQNVHEI